MTTRRLIKRARASADKFGWTPADFAGSDFDADLLDLIRRFQADRFMKPTGEVDRKTVEALLAYRQGQRDAMPTAQAEANLHGLGSIARMDADDPRVTRSEPFTGRTLYVSQVEVLVDALQDPYFLKGWDSVAAFAFGPVVQRLPKFDGVRRLCLFPVDLSAPFRSGREAQRVQDCEPDGLVVSVDRVQNHLIEQHQGDPLVDFLESMGDPGCPIAINADLSWPTRKAGRAACNAWRVCEAFDAALPVFPGAMAGKPTEYAIGQIVSWWSIFGRLRPQFCFPVFDTSTSLPGAIPNHVHRFLDWLNNRGIRGCGWRGVPSGDLYEAFVGPLPADVHRVDYI